jgi:hypothetical protein
MAAEPEAVGEETMRWTRFFAVPALALFVIACAKSESDFPEVDGWMRTGDVITYDADNLWEYINGAAELFIEYGVQTCRAADLTSDELTVAVDLYDMGSPLNAFGVFNRESPNKGGSLPHALKAVVSPPYQALLLKGTTYVKVNAVEGELTEATGRELLQQIAASLPGEPTPPTELDLLPQPGRVPGSEGYQAQGFLGLTELPQSLYAQYGVAEEEAWQGFVILPAVAASVWDALHEEWETLDHNGLTVLYNEIPYAGFVGAVQMEDRIVGAAGASDQAELLRRLDSITR